MSAFDFTARAMAVRSHGLIPATFAELAERAISAKIDRVHSSGHTVSGLGAAVYVCDERCTEALLAAHPACVFRTRNGRIFRLAAETGAILVEQAGARGDGATNDRPAIQTAINYAAAVTIPTIVFPAGHYRLHVPQRTTQSSTIQQAIHAFDGQGLVHPLGAHLKLIGRTARNKGRARLEFRDYLGRPFSEAYQIIDGGSGSMVWRGMGYLLRGHAGASPPADLNDRSSVWLENLEFDGTRPREIFGVASSWPANVADGSGWDETHKPFSAENDRYVGDMRFINCKMTRWGGEMLYVAGKSAQATGLTERDPLCYVRDCEFTDSDGSGINPSAVTLDADGVYIENVNLPVEGWLGRQGRLTNCVAVNCHWGGGIQGGVVNVSGTGAYTDPNRNLDTEPPYGVVDVVVRNCLGPWYQGWWVRGRIQLIDTQIVFGAISPNAEGSRECDLDIELVTDQTTRAYCAITGGNGTDGAMKTNDLILRIKSVHTDVAKAAGRMPTSAVIYSGSLGSNIQIHLSGASGGYSPAPSAALLDFAPIFTGHVPYTGFIPNAAVQNVETTPLLALRAPVVRLTTTATTGRFNVRLPTTEVAKGSRMRLVSVSPAILQINGNVPATSGLRCPGIVCMTNGMQLPLTFDGAAWTLDSAMPLMRGEIELSAASLIANYDELHAIAKLTHNGGAITYTFPSYGSRQLPIGAEGEIWHKGTSTLTLAAGSGATLTTRGGLLASAGTGSRINWCKTGTNEFTAWGDLA